MVRRIYPFVFLVTAILAGWTGAANAQQEDEDGIEFEPDNINEPAQEDPAIEMGEDPAIEMGEEDPAIDMGETESTEPDLAADLAEIDKPVEGDKTAPLGESRVSWQDIVTVVRKPFLKTGRVELSPLFGITMNDNIIQHLQGGVQANYYLTDVLSVGGEFAAYVKNLREPYDLVAFQARRLPAVNKYTWSGALNFGYVPIYGKFAVLDQYLVHWESYLTAGVGMTQSEVLPRDPALQPFTNLLITPNVGASMRFFLTKFLTVTVGVRDYVFVDKFEAPGRTELSGDVAKESAESALINHVMFQAAVSLWLPMSFEYTTFR